MNKVQQSRYKSLYQQHLSALQRQGKSDKTIDCYARALRRITERFDRCPDRLSADDLKEHFTQLVATHSWSTVKVDRNGLQFFYKHVLAKDWQWIDIVNPPTVKVLPDILTPTEIAHIIKAAHEARYRTYLLTTYSMGLRLSESLKLAVGDIDAERRRVHIRCAKGRKDRFVILPDAALEALRRYWTTHRHRRLLFPAGKTPTEQRRARVPMDRSGVQRSLKAIVRHCNIHKRVSIHTLRHSYATHLVEMGLNLRAIQQALGHESPQTTALYTQLTDPVQQNAADLINAMVDRLALEQDGEDT